MLSGNERPHRSSDTAFRIVDGEAVIVSPKEGVVRVLNNVGTSIWQMSDGKKSIKELVEKIVEEFDVERSIALADVSHFVGDLVKAELLQLKE